MRNFLLGVLTGTSTMVAGLILGGQAEPSSDVLRVNRIEIVDELGTVRLALGSNDAGGTVSVRDRLGRTALLASANDHGGVLVVNDRAGRQPALIASAAPTGGHLQVFAADGSVAIDAAGARQGELHVGGAGKLAPLSLGVTTGRGSITGRATASGTAFRLTADERGAGTFQTFVGTRATPLVALGSTDEGHGTIKTLAPNGRPLVLASASADGFGQIFTSNSEGIPLTALASDIHGPTLRVYSANGAAAVTLEPDEAGRGTLGLWLPDDTGRRWTPDDAPSP